MQIIRSPGDKGNNACKKLNSLITEQKVNPSTTIFTIWPTKDSSYSLWRDTRLLRRPIPSILPIKKQDCWSPIQPFASGSKNMYPNLKTIFMTVCLSIHSHDVIKRVNLSEGKQLIKLSKTGKYPGSNLITNKMLKESSEIIFMFLTMTFNTIFGNKTFLRRWKTSKINLV